MTLDEKKQEARRLLRRQGYTEKEIEEIIARAWPNDNQDKRT